MPQQEITLQPRRADPKQLRAFDTRDDRVELLGLLAHLSPQQRVAWFAWACSQATLGPSSVRPVVGSDTRRLAELARNCDKADKALTADIVCSLSVLTCNYALNLNDLVTELVRRVRGR